MSDSDDASERRRAIPLAISAAVILVAAAIGLVAGYVIWREPDWYAARDPSGLPAGAENELIKYGWQLVVDTPRHIGREASDPALRFAGNDLACTNCHLDAGLKRFAAPFVSTWASYPLMVNDDVFTLADRINGCMTHSMNGKPLPAGGRELEAFLAYIRWLGEGTPVGVRVAGMGLLPLKPAAEAPSAERGEAAFAANCARCHGADGQGAPNVSPKVGWAFPPLWGDGSFNSTSGMNHIEVAAAFVRANMPRGADYQSPIIGEQQAWDIAAFVTTRTRPVGPPE